jgi:hypothetical protein
MQRNVGLLFSKEAIAKDIYRSLLCNSFHSEQKKKHCTAGFHQDSATAHTAHIVYAGFVRCLRGQNCERSNDPHVLLIFILVILFFWNGLRDKFTTVTPRTEELKQNIRKKIINIPAEHLEMLNLFRMCGKCIYAEGQHVQYLL